MHGLDLAWSLGYRVVCCERGSLDVVTLRDNLIFHVHAGQLLTIAGLLDRAWNVKVVHTIEKLTGVLITWPSWGFR